MRRSLDRVEYDVLPLAHLSSPSHVEAILKGLVVRFDLDVGF